MSLPEFSPDYCSHCGDKLGNELVDGRERLYCSKCDEVEWLNPSICAGVIVEKDGEFLIQKRGIDPHKGKWSIPAGYLELEESPEQAARRELEEETGLRIIEKPHFLGHIAIEHPNGKRVVVAVFHIDFLGTEGQLNPEEEEVDKLEYWSYEELLDNNHKLDYTAYLDLIEKIKKK